MKIVYVAGPFRAATSWEIEQNIRRAEEVGHRVLLAGAFPLIPHANTRYFHGTAPAQVFLDGTMELLRRSDAVVLIDGWRRSSGAWLEKEEADRLGLPIFREAEVTSGIGNPATSWTRWLMSSGQGG
jgi:hypothetical protein